LRDVSLGRDPLGKSLAELPGELGLFTMKKGITKANVSCYFKTGEVYSINIQLRLTCI